MIFSAQWRQCLPIWLIIQQHLVNSSYFHLLYHCQDNFWWPPFAESSQHLVWTLQGLIGSFRTGVASTAAQAGPTDSTIQLSGRVEVISRYILPAACCPSPGLCVAAFVQLRTFHHFTTSFIPYSLLCVCSTKLFMVQTWHVGSPHPFLILYRFGEYWSSHTIGGFLWKITLPKMYLVYACVGVADDKHIVTESSYMWNWGSGPCETFKPVTHFLRDWGWVTWHLWEPLVLTVRTALAYQTLHVSSGLPKSVWDYSAEMPNNWRWRTSRISLPSQCLSVLLPPVFQQPFFVPFQSIKHQLLLLRYSQINIKMKYV